MASVLLSASVERFNFSRMRDFFTKFRSYSVEGLLSTGLTPSSLTFILCTQLFLKGLYVKEDKLIIIRNLEAFDGFSNGFFCTRRGLAAVRAAHVLCWS